MTQPEDRTRTYAGLTEEPTHQHEPHLGERVSSGAASVHPEEPRRHPVAYAALALSLICLLWLALTAGGDDGYQKVRVGNQDCVSVPQDTGPAVLYCRTTATIK